MSNEINENQLKKQLIELYETYLIDEENKDVQKQADFLYSKLLAAKLILNKDLNEAVDLLSNLSSWSKESTERTSAKRISKENVIEILKKFKKIDFLF